MVGECAPSITILPYGIGSNEMVPILMADTFLLCLGHGCCPLGGFRMDVSFVDRTEQDWVDLNLSRSCARHPSSFWFSFFPSSFSFSSHAVQRSCHPLRSCPSAYVHHHRLQYFLFPFLLTWPISLISHIVISTLALLELKLRTLVSLPR